MYCTQVIHSLKQTSTLEYDFKYLHFSTALV